MQASWLAFIQDETKIDSVIYRYRKLGFNACCDLPGNTFYKELYDNIPNCKDELFNKLMIISLIMKFWQRVDFRHNLPEKSPELTISFVICQFFPMTHGSVGNPAV